MGDSIGHWEGDTLVVDTVGFNDKTEINGYQHTDALHIVERFRRAEYNTLQYEATLEDPNVFVKPWTVSRGFALRPDYVQGGRIRLRAQSRLQRSFREEEIARFQKRR